MDIRSQSHRRVQAADMAEWIERQTDKWWLVDGDPTLTQQIDFPCPGDELAGAIRKIGKDLLVRDPKGLEKGSTVSADQIGELADVVNVDGVRTFLCAWADASANNEWLLSEDVAATKAYAGS